jgi:hypothetical protein
LGRIGNVPHAGDPLAFAAVDRYFEFMPERFRRIVAVVLALTFVVGLVPSGVRAADAGVKMVLAAATEMPTSGKCDGCCNGCGDDHQAMTSGACSASCGNFVALPSMAIAFEAAPGETTWHLAGPSRAGHTVPPDPYPPKPAVLS